MKFKIVLPRFVLSAAVLAALAPSAYAHHSFASFEMTQTLSIAGTVKRFEWTNPHSWIVLEVSGAPGATEEWRFEGAPPVNMIRSGWTEDSLMPGDKVTISYHPRKDASHGGSFASVIMANGKQIGNQGPPPGGEGSGGPGGPGGGPPGGAPPAGGTAPATGGTK